MSTQPIEPLGIKSHELSPLLVGGGGPEDSFGEIQNLAVVTSKQADGPVAAPAEPIPAEDFDHMFEVEGEVVRLPLGMICLGDESGNFAIDVGRLRQLPHLRGPGFAFALLDVGLGNVVKDDGHCREVVQQAESGVQLVGFDQQIVGQPGFMQRSQPAHDLGLQHPIGVRLILDDVTNTLELFVLL